MTTFGIQDGAVTMVTSAGGPVRLSPGAVEDLLDLFDAERAVQLFNDLYEAAQKTDWFIPRFTSLRHGRAA